MKPSKLSDFLKKDFPITNKVDLNFKEIVILDLLPFKLLNVTHLDLSYNRLESLDGISQFNNLIYLNLSNNLLKTLQPLTKISKKEVLSVLLIKGNPAARHPNLIPLVMNIFPNLRECDKELINYSTHKDIMQAMELSQSLIPYLYINEQFILKIHKEIQFLNMKKELFSVALSRLDKSLLPNYFDMKEFSLKQINKYKDLNIDIPNTKIRPTSIMEYISKVQSQLQINSAHLEEEIVCKIYRWLYCEILLFLHSQGNVDLQCFLKDYEENSLASYEKSYNDSCESLNKLDGITFDLLKFSQLSHYPQSLLHFPVFGCNSEYLNALIFVLHKQVSVLQSLLKERKCLLAEEFSDECDEVQSPPSKISYPILHSQEYCSPSVLKDFISPSNKISQPFFVNEGNHFLSPTFREENTRNENIFNKEEVVSRLEFDESDLDITNSFEELSQSIEELLNDEEKN